MLELLAPAGSPEAVTAAVQNGADAVYLSFDDLNDCPEAVNFLDTGFEAAVRYCRVRGCKVYLALNTAVREEELPKAAGLALRAQRAGVDAVILRDLGVLTILRSLLPEMPLFADHRLGFYTPESAVAAATMGFTRIFLPPEMPLEQIKRMAKAPVETAVFVQTSMCAAAAGQCRLSAAMNRGSADRGRCSAPCRESYTLGGRWDTTPLSWKDRTLIPDVKALEEAGVACACIGDRDRRVEYVAAYTSVLREAIQEEQQPAASERRTLEEVFCPHGVAAKDVFEPVEPRNEPDSKAIERFCAELRRTYTETELRRVPVNFAVAAQSPDQPVRLGAQDEGKHLALMEGPLPDPMGDLELTEDGLREIMYRTAGTPFRCESVESVLGEGLRVSSIELDEARRRLLYKLSEERAAVPRRKEGAYPDAPRPASMPTLPVMIFSVQTAEQLTPALAELSPACVYVPLEVLFQRPECVRPFTERGCGVAAALPPVACGSIEEKKLRTMLSAVRENGVEEALTGNIGLALMAGQEGFKLRGDLELSINNDYALQRLKETGFVSATLSPELTLDQIRLLNKPLDTEIAVYGRLPVMVTETCLLKTSAGRCTCTTPGQMADTQGGVWPVTRSFGCRNSVWMNKKLWLEDVAQDWVQSGLWAGRLIFSTESPRECVDVAGAYLRGEGYRPNGMTRGLYYRGVE